VLAIVGVLGAHAAAVAEAAERFAEPWGGLDLSSEAEAFDGTRYYEEEMGAGLERRFFSCCRLVPATALVALKHRAWEVEQQNLVHNRRCVNLDPGFVDLHKVVLASFKDGPQKLYLGEGVWADMVLCFESGAFTALRWTFPDLRAGAHRDFFMAARRRYKELLRRCDDC
jgi:hypothetical protein